MSKHTPGPWKAVRNSSFWEVVYPWPEQSIEDANKFSPSTAYAWGKSEEEKEANARLIAAAPELLAALQSIIALDDKVDPEGLFRGLESINSRSAIAKATGG